MRTFIVWKDLLVELLNFLKNGEYLFPGEAAILPKKKPNNQYIAIDKTLINLKKKSYIVYLDVRKQLDLHYIHLLYCTHLSFCNSRSSVFVCFFFCTLNSKQLFFNYTFLVGFCILAYIHLNFRLKVIKKYVLIVKYKWLKSAQHLSHNKQVVLCFCNLNT